MENIGRHTRVSRRFHGTSPRRHRGCSCSTTRSLTSPPVPSRSCAGARTSVCGSVSSPCSDGYVDRTHSPGNALSPRESHRRDQTRSVLYSDVIHRLKLDHNVLRGFQGNEWLGLNSLKDLDLSYNQLREIRPTMWDGLGSLEALDMYSNDISSIQSGAFEQLFYLKILDLSSNPLVAIRNDMWNGLGLL